MTLATMKFIAVISFMCGTDNVNSVNEEAIHICHEYYVNCAVVGAGDKDFKKLEQCAIKRGDDYDAALKRAERELNQTESKDK